MSPVAVPVSPGLSAHPAGVRVGEADLGGDQLPRQPAPLLPLSDGHCLKQRKVSEMKYKELNNNIII